MRNLRSVSSFLKSLGVTLGAAALLLNAVGCGSDTRQVDAPPVQPDQPNATASARAAGAAMETPTLDSFKSDLTDGKTQIDAALSSLNKLTDPRTPAAELRGAYDTYTDQLARLQQHSQMMKQEAEGMRDARAAYFAKWEAKNAEIDNPAIRASAEARQARLRAAHERITTASLAARDAYEPFMKDLNDIRKFLATELSPQSTAMMADATKKANADGAVVKGKIDAVTAELDAVIGATGNTGGTGGPQ